MQRALSVENEAYLSNELKTHGLLKAVHDKIRQIAIADINAIVRKDEATGLPIVPVDPTIARLINMFRILRRCGLEALSVKELAAVLEICLRVSSVFETLRTFDKGVVTALNAPRTVDQIASQVDSVAQSAYETLGLIIAKTFALGDYFNSQVEGAGEHFARILTLSQEAQATLADMKRLARREISVRFADSFEQEASRHTRAAWIWTAGTAACAAVGILSTTQSLHSVTRQITTLPAAKLFAIEIPHLVIVGFVFYLMYFCTKTASVHRHNQIANLQRRNILGAASIVADAATTDAFKESILVQAATAAFKL